MMWRVILFWLLAVASARADLPRHYTLGGASAASPLIKSIALPNNAIITNGYDGLARLTTTALNNQWGHTLDGYMYGLDALGLVTNMTRELGLTTNTVTISYDPIGELDSWAGREPGGGLRHNEQFSFGYDAGGNLIVRTNDAFLQYFDVNNLSQLFLVSNTGSMTVTGSVPAPASAVTVNGIGADLYSDLTFAATNLRLISGLNAYTIAANNLYDVQAQTGVTELNLPIFAINADIIGRIEDAAEGKLSYDSENQLDSVVSVPWHWSVSFTYDGLGRRRINEQTSNGSTITNELHYIYDGMQVLQERDFNNVPQVTYTRGPDLSLTLDGAGGIGGLLARTDANGSTYYHADGNGNITALINGNQNIAARYEYGPYGKMLGEWGPLANANRYRFSSKEQDMQTGLYYYGYRFYSPNLQRWMTPDPLGEAASPNLYQFVGNDPVNHIDPWGLWEQYGNEPTGEQADDALYGLQYGLDMAERFPDFLDYLGDQSGLTGLLGISPSDGMTAMGGHWPEFGAEGGMGFEPESGLLGKAEKELPKTKVPCPEGKPFTQAQKRQILDANRARNGGQLRSDLSGQPLVPAQQSRRGITPSPNEAQVNHVFPQSLGGQNTLGNAQVLSRQENQTKGNKYPYP